MSREIQKVALVIVDGFGITDDSPGNAVIRANTPIWNKLLDKYPHIEIQASGTNVGLPDGIMGNSEVGHLTIGTGRITFQSLELINRSCIDGTIEKNPVISQIRNHLGITGGKLHLMGLLSDGGVHSHQNHLFKLFKIFSDDSFKVAVHAFTDGRDKPPRSAYDFVRNLLKVIDQYPDVYLSSIIGRYYVMDRDNKWERTKIAFDMLTMMDGNEVDALSTIKKRYEVNETDEFFKPIIVDSKGKIENGDAVLFFNYRPDRARQITMALNNMHDFGILSIKDLYYSTMTKYVDSWSFPVLFHTPKIKNSLAEIISSYKLTQSHVAETEKYAHVTYFLNGGIEKVFARETRILIPSLKVATYDLQPSMSTIEIANKVVEEIKKRQDFVVVNIAAPDMVGHTGKLDATIKAVQIMDDAFGMIYDTCIKEGYVMCVTSDHGNCEKMIDGDQPHTAHTTNLVPFLVTADVKLKKTGGLENVAPTILDLMKLEKPKDMTGSSLVIK